jgi:hypothetical protein
MKKKIDPKFKEWTPDELEELKNTMQNICSPELFAKLYHPKGDFKAYVAGIDMMEKELANLDPILCNLDLCMCSFIVVVVVFVVVVFLSGLF